MCKRRSLVLLFGLLFASLLQAQNHFTSSPDSLLIIDKIILSGNKITKSNIILRELELKAGDRIFPHQLSTKIKRSKENLLNRSLFNFVDIVPQRHDFNKINLYIRLTERWYIWPIPILSYADRNFNIWWTDHNFSHTNFGIDIQDNNFRGRMERLDFIIQGGYDRSLLLKWSTPYINKKQTWGIGMYGGFILNHEIDYTLKDNRLVYYQDRHNYASRYYFAQLMATFRPKFNETHYLYLTYNSYQFADSILLLNPDFAFGQRKFSYLSLEYDFKLDFRDYAPYPLNGYYFEVNVLKEGLGMLNNKVKQFSIYLGFDQYIHLQKRWYFAYNISTKVVTNKYQPHFLQQGLGYKPLTLRGYQLYVVNGQAFGMFRSNLKFELIPRSKAQFNFIKTDKFSKFFYALYANLFLDTGYIIDNRINSRQPLTNRLLFGTGVGLDYITYYDVVLRLEYTINRENEKALFISFVAPI